MSTENKPKLLLVEDDINLGFVVKDNLEDRNFDVTHVDDGEKALKIFKEKQFDLCLLDVMLPKKDGFTLAADIRAIDQEVPIIFLTAKNMKEDKLHGFRLGADDYITKPFSMEELVLRIEVFLKRSGKDRTTTIGEQMFKINSYQFDYPNLELIGPGDTKRLTQREADVLRMLCLEQEKVVKKEDILRKIWGSNDYFAGRSLDVFISKLRKYLNEDDSVEISNYHGVGFKLVIKK